ncbi:MAG: prolipoprotein diacylglyceryl transferase [Lachnospiraceae bacterium]|nr:prolipoprotein diacylglyceryl transferase [Lachnospiraceae bacterium]
MSSYNGADIIFPHLGIVIPKIRDHITVFGFDIMFYGIVIGLGFLIGMLIVTADAKRRGQDPDAYWDMFIYGIIAAVIGARLYYVAFRWDNYKNDPVQILNIRGGGLAIYGGIIGGALAIIIYCKIKKKNFLEMLDSVVLGLWFGQALGRWGNFFNCEAFGEYTDTLLAMRMKESLVNPSAITEKMKLHMITDAGINYIQVHPTFLYESLWNLASLGIGLWYGRKVQKFKGEIFYLYLALYGIGRTWIEGLRTDSLYIAGTGLRVSQCLSALLAVFGITMILVKRIQLKKAGETQKAIE